MLFRPRYGRIGFFALPFLWLFELFAPVIELGGMVTIGLAACYGILSREFFLQRSEEHTSELQSQSNLVCRLLLEKKKIYGNRESHCVTNLWLRYTESME